MAQSAERGPGFAGSVVMFVVLVFAVTWAFWLAAWAAGGASAGHLRAGLPTLWFYSGVFAPAFVAVWLIWPRFGAEPWYLLLVATIGSTILLGQAGEEIGWRGYALPRLAARLGLARASILIGVIWAAWHLPSFSFRGPRRPANHSRST